MAKKPDDVESKELRAQQIVDLFTQEHVELLVDEDISDVENHREFFLLFDYRGTDGRFLIPTKIDDTHGNLGGHDPVDMSVPFKYFKVSKMNNAKLVDG